MLNVPPEQIRAARLARQKARRACQDDWVSVAPHLVQVVQFFGRLHTHWRALVGPTGAVVWQGLDWTAVEATMNRIGLKPRHPERFDDWLQVMENEGLRIKNAA